MAIALSQVHPLKWPRALRKFYVKQKLSQTLFLRRANQLSRESELWILYSVLDAKHCSLFLLSRSYQWRELILKWGEAWRGIRWALQPANTIEQAMHLKSCWFLSTVILYEPGPVWLEDKIKSLTSEPELELLSSSSFSSSTTTLSTSPLSSCSLLLGTLNVLCCTQYSNSSCVSSTSACKAFYLAHETQKQETFVLHLRGPCILQSETKMCSRTLRVPVRHSNRSHHL